MFKRIPKSGLFRAGQTLRAPSRRYAIAPDPATATARRTRDLLIGLGVGTIVTALALEVLAIAPIWRKVQVDADGPMQQAASGSGASAKQGPRPTQYADAKTTQEVIELLTKQLREEQVTTDPDEILGHAQSPNTYHGELLCTSNRV